MPAGGHVSLRGPAGLFTLDPADARPAAFLAGGIGVTPFVSMLRKAAHSRLARELWLFYSNRRPEDAAFLEELTELPKRNARCRFVGTMVEMDKSSRPWSGETGFIDQGLLERHVPSIRARYRARPAGRLRSSHCAASRTVATPMSGAHRLQIAPSDAQARRPTIACGTFGRTFLRLT